MERLWEMHRDERYREKQRDTETHRDTKRRRETHRYGITKTHRDTQRDTSSTERENWHCVSHLDISFHRPVEIGSMLLLKGAVIFVHDRTMVTEVTAQVLNPTKSNNKNTSTLSSPYLLLFFLGDSFLTNRFYFTFKCEKAIKKLPTVLPVTYEGLAEKRWEEKGRAEKKNETREASRCW